MFYPNAIAQVQGEDYGKGPSTTKSVSQNGSGVHVHFHTGNFPPPYQGFDGILGVDMLDALSVDPVKDAIRSRAYFAIRV